MSAPTITRTVGRSLVLVVLALAAAPAGLVGSVACAGADHGDRIAVAIDFGPLTEAGHRRPPVCVPVTPGMTGAEVLEARAELLGTEPPRYAPSGLLCAIDGLPETGCGDTAVDGSYQYWAYSLGSADGWQHADTGPALRQADPAVSEGWHFLADGAGNPSDPPPELASDPEALCAEAAAEVPGDDPVVSAAPDLDDGAGDGAPLGAVAGAAGIVVLTGVALTLARRRST